MTPVKLISCFFWKCKFLLLVQVVLDVFYCCRISKTMAAAGADQKTLISKMGEGVPVFENSFSSCSGNCCKVITPYHFKFIKKIKNTKIVLFHLLLQLRI